MAGSSPVAQAAEQAAPDYDAATRSARELLQKLIEVDTTSPPGNEKRAVDLVRERLEAEGIPYDVTEFAPGRENITARLKGAGHGKPVMLIAHSDVVGAEGQAWTVPAHKLTEKDGYLYGRGVYDILSMAAVNLEVFLMLKREGVKLDRDVIFALTGDEESGGAGVQYLLKHKRESLDAGIAFNEVGGPVLDEHGKVVFTQLQSAEKIYQDFELSAKGSTGHSSVPLADNAIYKLSRALAKLGAHRFPARLLPVTRAYFAERAKLESDRKLGAAMKTLAQSKGALPAAALKVIDADPIQTANVRTTCVATLLSGGTRVNALPAEAKAVINCRILPDETIESVQRQLGQLLGPEITVRQTGEFGGHPEPSPVEGLDIDAVKEIIGQMWPGVPVIPFLSRGATDSRYLRGAGIPSYGFSPIAISELDARRAHGIDERIPAASLRPAIEFFHRLMVRLAGSAS